MSISDLKNISAEELKSAAKEKIAEAKGNLKGAAADLIEENKEQLKDAAVDIAETEAQKVIDDVAEEIGVDSQLVPQVSGVINSARKEASGMSTDDLRNISAEELKSAAKENIAEAKGNLKGAAADLIEENKE